jgi:hypothetical protein
VDYENERYVRQYVTETVNFLCLPWQSRMLLRYIGVYFDRAGVFSLGECEPAKGIAVKARCPESFVATALPPLLRGGSGPLKLYRDEASGQLILYWPNFMAAQNAKQSDRQRARASRERRRAEADAAKLVPNWGELSRNATVTPGDTSGTPSDTDDAHCDAVDTNVTKPSLCTRDRDRDSAERTARTAQSSDDADPRATEILKLLQDSRAACDLGVATLGCAEALLGVADSSGRNGSAPPGQNSEHVRLAIRQALAEADMAHDTAERWSGDLLRRKLRTFVEQRPRPAKPPGAQQHEQTKAEVAASAKRDRQRARSDQAAHDKAAAGAVSTQDAAVLARKVASALSMPGKGDK